MLANDQGTAFSATSEFAKTWSAFMAEGASARLILVVFLGTLAFNMQDVLLEPYGGKSWGWRLVKPRG